MTAVSCKLNNRVRKKLTLQNNKYHYKYLIVLIFPIILGSEAHASEGFVRPLSLSFETQKSDRSYPLDIQFVGYPQIREATQLHQWPLWVRHEIVVPVFFRDPHPRMLMIQFPGLRLQRSLELAARFVDLIETQPDLILTYLESDVVRLNSSREKGNPVGYLHYHRIEGKKSKSRFLNLPRLLRKHESPLVLQYWDHRPSHFSKFVTEKTM